MRKNPGNQNETQPTNSTEATKAPDTTETTQPVNTTPIADTTIPTNEDWIPDTELVITDSSGTVTIWSPYLDPSYHISALRNDNGESLIFDFTSLIRAAATINGSVK